MILVVDDDIGILEAVRSILEEDGHEVATFERAAAALEHAAAVAPALILSDVIMPEITGYEFRRAYELRFPSRTTPFVFMSSLSDRSSIDIGYELGADDYLVKPVDAATLTNRVRAIIRGAKARSEILFRGSIERFPFMRILQFCERKGLTGEVDVSAPGLSATLEFGAGALLEHQFDSHQHVLDRLLDLEQGTFVIRSKPVTFDSIAPEAASEGAPEALASKPPGIVTTKRLGQHTFVLHTELLVHPIRQVLSIVTLNGRMLQKKTAPVETDDAAEIADIIRQQHESSETSLTEMVSERIRKHAPDPATLKSRVDDLFEVGFEKYRAGDHRGALACWEEAQLIDPTDKTLVANIEVVRRKLERSD